MAGLTSREGEAIKKALDLDTLDRLSYKVSELERLIKAEVGMTDHRAREATRILEPKKDVTGSEIRPTGSLFENLTRGLDESGLISALTVVKGVMLEVESKRAVWLEKAHAREDHAGFLPDKKYDRHVYNSITASS